MLPAVGPTLLLRLHSGALSGVLSRRFEQLRAGNGSGGQTGMRKSKPASFCDSLCAKAEIQSMG